MSPTDDDELERAADEAEAELEGEMEGDEPEGEEDTSPEPAAVRASVQPAAIAAPPAASTPSPHRRKKRGLRPFVARPPTREVGVGDVPPAGVGIRTSNDGSKNVSLIWSDIVDQLREKGMDPGVIWIRVRRYALGVARTPENAALDKGQIDGMAVCGSEGVSPGEMLVEYVTDVLHFTSIPHAPARYVFDFYFKSGNSTKVSAPQGELILAHPTEINAQRKAAAEFMLRRGNAEARSGFGAMPNVSWRGGGGGSYPAGGYPPGAYAPPQAAPAAPAAPPAALPPAPPPLPTGVSPELVEMQRQLYEDRARLERTAGIYDERARQEGVRAAQPAAAVETPAAQEARLVGAVVKALAAAGVLVGPNAAPTAQLSPQSVTQQVAAPMSAAREFFAQMREFKKIEREMAIEFAPEEEEEPSEPKPPATALATVPAEDPYAMKEMAPLSVTRMIGMHTPILGGPRKPGEGMFDYGVRIASSNPEGAVKLAQGIQNGPLGRGLQKILEQSAMGQAIAAKTAQIAQNTVEMPVNGAALPPPPPSVNGAAKPFRPIG
jgi:hypothetical protein